MFFISQNPFLIVLMEGKMALAFSAQDHFLCQVC